MLKLPLSKADDDIPAQAVLIIAEHCFFAGGNFIQAAGKHWEGDFR